ncbi:MAG: polymerase, sigma-24 subunit, subfamily [Modestobacter sp.]|nr:polymerase, sigma-24 subunit, subfamily [Modestobacter sp.]
MTVRSSASTGCGRTTSRPWCDARRQVLPDEVEDVVAETFVVAWRRLGEAPAYGLPWLLGVARRISANVRRDRRVRRRRSATRPPPTTPPCSPPSRWSPACWSGTTARRRRSSRPPSPPRGSITGSITCASGYVSAIAPGDVAVRLLPDRLPSGWSYAQILARENPTARCVPPSLTALRADATGLVTGRISVTGPVDARIDRGKLTVQTVPDTVFGYAARRFDGTVDVPVHRWCGATSRAGSGRQR